MVVGFAGSLGEKETIHKAIHLQHLHRFVLQIQQKDIGIGVRKGIENRQLLFPLGLVLFQKLSLLRLPLQSRLHPLLGFMPLIHLDDHAIGTNRHAIRSTIDIGRIAVPVVDPLGIPQPILDVVAGLILLIEDMLPVFPIHPGLILRMDFLEPNGPGIGDFKGIVVAHDPLEGR